MKSNREKILAVLIMAIIVLGGCSTANRLSEPVGKFRVASERALTVTRPYITQLNKVERNLKFTEAFADASIKINDTFLSPTFAPEGIRARLEAFEVIDVYTARLAEIADSKATSKLRTNAKALGDNLTSLSTRIDKIINKGDFLFFLIFFKHIAQ